MKFKYDGEKLVKALRTKRIIELDIDIRNAARKIGTSAATLSRIENGSTPDAETLAALCYWTCINMYECFSPVANRKTKHQ